MRNVSWPEFCLVGLWARFVLLFGEAKKRSSSKGNCGSYACLTEFQRRFWSKVWKALVRFKRICGECSQKRSKRLRAGQLRFNKVLEKVPNLASVKVHSRALGHKTWVLKTSEGTRRSQ